MNEPEEDISPIGDLTPLEQEVAGVLAKHGVAADTDLVSASCAPPSASLSWPRL